ncbi:hypothetical protein GCM10017567_73250 [Amycolatopsis bullii]|uniref:Uncharacterized protein n=1 Tax=Amycolatopsis bullii TaxID=941987 RepID=A0ABQ3KRG6_9PSEU|nr:hypothetical protein GCM10017567_73250 [Amycolatopsis bullii]
MPVMGKAQLETGLAAFKAAPAAILGLANRYGGLGIPGAACRIVVPDGKPDAASRWLSTAPRGVHTTKGFPRQATGDLVYTPRARKTRWQRLARRTNSGRTPPPPEWTG